MMKSVAVLLVCGVCAVLPASLLHADQADQDGGPAAFVADEAFYERRLESFSEHLPFSYKDPPRWRQAMTDLLVVLSGPEEVVRKVLPPSVLGFHSSSILREWRNPSLQFVPADMPDPYLYEQVHRALALYTVRNPELVTRFVSPRSPLSLTSPAVYATCLLGVDGLMWVAAHPEASDELQAKAMLLPLAVADYSVLRLQICGGTLVTRDNAPVPSAPGQAMKWENWRAMLFLRVQTHPPTRALLTNGLLAIPPKLLEVRRFIPLFAVSGSGPWIDLVRQLAAESEDPAAAEHLTALAEAMTELEQKLAEDVRRLGLRSIRWKQIAPYEDEAAPALLAQCERELASCEPGEVLRTYVPCVDRMWTVDVTLKPLSEILWSLDWLITEKDRRIRELHLRP